ncbi:integrase domain-containing protein [Shewanella sp. Isolate11]|uniref:integrase domain-containing protein n=1 Tax=Shewanella sp. Isolate11 TaxID=2908530 RepID=UPI001EFDF1E9|nr:integrase domain-containing protein [Shewanella sp. Isolate11]MCG9697233.1 integrase domain-containing protein [Shewanella sp. Isolate11]
MARRTTPLTDTEIKKAKPKLKEYNLTDGAGLQLRVKPTGSKLWLFNYYHPVTKKRKNFSLGLYPDISLSVARKLTQEARTLLAQGSDPKSDRDEKLAAQNAIIEHTLINVAKDWMECKKEAVTEKHAAKTWSSLELHIFSDLGKVPISQITAPKVISILRTIEAKGHLDTVKRLCQRLNEIMVFAVNTGLIHSNPLSGIKSVFKQPKKNHLAAMQPHELPELMQAIANASIHKLTRLLLEWQLHTITRPNEAACARWDEIDMENRLWTIPASTMKKRRDHQIPLTDETIALLEILRPISGHREYLFPSTRNPKKHYNEQTANAALIRMQLKGRTTAHGFRSLASTTLNEQGFDPDVVEVALAHVDKNQVRSAYNRSVYLERRKVMMAWWSEHITQAASGNFSLVGLKNLHVM